MPILTFKQRVQVVDGALKEHYRQFMECKRVPNDYILMFTEGGESDAVACAIEAAVSKRIADWLDGMYGDEMPNTIQDIRDCNLV